MKGTGYIKFYILSLLVAYGSYANDVTITDIHKLWKTPVAAYQTECMCQTGLRQVVANEFYKYGRMPDDPCFKCFLRCLGSKVEAIEFKTGEVNVERWSELFAHLDVALAQKCSEFAEPDVCQKAYLMVKCVNDELSKRFLP